MFVVVVVIVVSRPSAASFALFSKSSFPFCFFDDCVGEAIPRKPVFVIDDCGDMCRQMAACITLGFGRTDRQTDGRQPRSQSVNSLNRRAALSVCLSDVEAPIALQRGSA
eukprot:Selendium_serpulae@DN6238_c1_g1_i2.p1